MKIDTKLGKLDRLIIEQKKDPDKAIEMAGLTYISEQTNCISRVKKGKGFSYFDDEDKKITDKKTLKRIISLHIPPAWNDVWICNKDNGHIQATGVDQKKRKQYIYHPEWERIRNQAKFDAILPFSKVLPIIRKEIAKNLKQKELNKQKILALVLELMDITHIRIGNEEYAKENKSYGLTTFQNKHVEVKGDNIKFQFMGKSNVKHSYTIHDRQLAKIIKNCLEIPGQDLFQYYDDQEELHRINSEDINDFLQTITKLPISAKDFRTWAGTTIGIKELHKIGPYETKQDAKKKYTTVIKAIANELGNTCAVCKKYYIHPAVNQSYLDKKLHTIVDKKIKNHSHDMLLSPYEMAVIEILNEYLIIPTK